MTDTTQVVEALQALMKKNEGRTKAGRMRELLPVIETSHAAGVPHEKILEILNSQGLGLSLKAYSVMLWRIRKKLKDAVPLQPKIAPTNLNNLKPAGQTGKKPAGKGNPASTPGEPDRFNWDVSEKKPIEW